MAKITIDELARMVKEGFDRTASKDEMTKGFKGVHDRLGDIDGRLDRMESGRIEKLEDNMRLVKTKLGIR